MTTIRSSMKSPTNRQKLSKLRALGFYVFGTVVLIYMSFLIQLIYRYHGTTTYNNIRSDSDTMYLQARLKQQQQQHDPASDIFYEHDNNQVQVTTNTILDMEQPQQQHLASYSSLWSLPKQLRGQSMESWYHTEHSKMIQTNQMRTQQRRTRTQTYGAAITTPFHLATPTGIHQDMSSSSSFKNLPHVLCGKNASTSSSSSAITSQSTVLITGIFQSPIGVHLALYLYTHCGVTNIIGIDPLLPNTQLHRLKVSFGPLALLTKTISNFVFHIPHIGVQTSATGSHDEDEEASAKGSSYYNIVERFSPTHIVHLLSVNSQYAYSRQSAAGPQEDHMLDHVDIPYHDSIRSRSTSGNFTITTEEESSSSSSWWSAYGPNRPMNMIRQTRFAMEHILKSISQVQWKHQLMELHRTTTSILEQDEQTTITTHGQPSFVYVSCTTGNTGTAENTILPELQDALASSYANMHNVSSIGLRFGTVYGPWDHYLTPMYRMAERAIKTTGSPILPISDNNSNVLDLIHVDDTISAIVSAMQLDFNDEKGKRNVVFRMDSKERHSLLQVSKLMEDVFPRNSNSTTTTSNTMATENSAFSQEQQPFTTTYWKPQILLSVGIRKLLSWHYQLAYMFGPSHFESPYISVAQKEFEKEIHKRGQALLLQSGIADCPSSDVHCLRGLLTSRIPCSSECAMSSSSLCTPSMFDSVLDDIRESTQGCNAVLYTISLGPNDASIPHRMGPSDPHFDGIDVCNVVFIARESPLAQKIVRSIPMEGTTTSNTTIALAAELSEQELEDRLNMYNCKVETDGWTTCWVPINATATSVTNEMSMLKISPGRLFAPTVKYAMFVDATFPVLPSQDDVEFLLSQVYRKAQPERMVTSRLEEKKTTRSEGAPQIVYKYKIPPQPAKRSILFVSPIRRFDETSKLTLRSAMKLMLEEIGRYEESDSLRLQRFLYEGLPGMVNKDEQRSIHEPLHKYTHTSFYIRSKWIIHDMNLEEARQLRCDWFQEHSLWGNELDSLSLAAVLARRDIDRRIKWGELDQRAIVSMPEIPEGLTDDNDWKMVWTDDTTRFLTSKARGVVVDVDSGLPEKAGLYVRIISDNEMLSARTRWVSEGTTE